MNNKLAQIVNLINKIDRQHIQFAYLVLMWAAFVIARSPSDGGTGPI